MHDAGYKKELQSRAKRVLDYLEQKIPFSRLAKKLIAQRSSVIRTLKSQGDMSKVSKMPLLFDAAMAELGNGQWGEAVQELKKCLEEIVGSPAEPG